MARLDDLVRATLRDMAREARPADLARAAMAQARRTRRSRLVRLLGGLTALLTVGAVVPVVGLLGATDKPRPAAVTTLYYSDGTVLAELGGTGGDVLGPTGLVVTQVLSELANSPASSLKGMSWAQLRTAGLRVTTTLDARAQRALEDAIDPNGADSLLAAQPVDLQPAAVMVEPGTGRILAYHGGADGTDFAGIHVDEVGDMAGFGRHPPGGSFRVHALAAALQNGYSVHSRWDSDQPDLPGRVAGIPIRNTGNCPNAARICSLADATAPGVETIFYALTVSVGPANVLAMARDAGIDSMWDNSGDRVGLVGADPNGIVPSRFGFEIGLGQYRVTVVDQANAMATYAAGGVRARAHFVQAVWQDDTPVWAETLPTADQTPVLRATAVADLSWALSRTEAGRIEGHDSAAKTGNWQYRTSTNENEHAWMVGYTRRLAMAVWVGNRDGGPIRSADNAAIYGTGLPAEIYRDVMTATHTAMGLSSLPFPAPVYAGELNPPGSVPQ